MRREAEMLTQLCSGIRFQDVELLPTPCGEGGDGGRYCFNLATRMQRQFAFCEMIHTATSRQKALAEFKVLAKSRGGECLSKRYISNQVKLRWRCSMGHEWLAIPIGITKGKWCQICHLEKLRRASILTIETMQKVAIERGGQCLSKEYINAHSKLLWRCAAGHEWTAKPYIIKNAKTWCPFCAGNIRLDLKKMKEAAQRFGGHCLSEKYKDTGSPLLWICAEGHKWETNYDSVKAGHWCPICSSGVSERICRKLLERLTGATFAKARPAWLKNERGWKMELDGFAPDLKLAFEYHGKQHFFTHKFFHAGRHNFEQRKRDDERKKQLCQENGVTLLEVPYTISHGEMQMFLSGLLEKTRPELHLNNSPIEIKSLDAWLKKDLDELRKLAQERGGELLSTFYVNSDTKLKWRCSEGHEWLAISDNVKHRGSWCPECAAKSSALKRANTIENMIALAKSRGGECLSKFYSNQKDRLRWRCAEGHEWETTGALVKVGRWCPKCGRLNVGRKFALTIEDMREVARARGGACLSENYVNGRQKLLWRCSKGHEWRAIGAMVRHRSWCPICAGKIPKVAALNQLIKLAIERGGELVSKKYMGVDDPLLWKCKCGSEWKASAHSIKNGTWCPACSVEKRALKRRTHTIQEMQQIAKSRGGVCLSENYQSASKKLRWRCAKGHEWSTIPSVVMAGRWCPVCGSKKRGIKQANTIGKMMALAKAKGGECLSSHYQNNKTKLRWLCANGHEWETIPNSIVSGYWCPVCARKKSKHR